MSESDFRNTSGDGLENLGNLILKELKLIRNDMKAEVRRLGKEIKFLYLAENYKNKDLSDLHSSCFDITDLDVCGNSSFNDVVQQNHEGEFNFFQQNVSCNADNQASYKSTSLNKANKQSLTDIVDKLKSKKIGVIQEIPDVTVNYNQFSSVENVKTENNSEDENTRNASSEIEISDFLKVDFSQTCIEKKAVSMFDGNGFRFSDVKLSTLQKECEVDCNLNSHINNNKEPKIESVVSLNQVKDNVSAAKVDIENNFCLTNCKNEHNKISNNVSDKAYEANQENEILSETAQLRQIITNFKCEYCLKPFRHYSSYQSHLRIHTGEKPFVCSLCHKTFSQKGNLKTHMLFHTNEKPFFCEICNKRFVQKSSLKNHLRIHTGEKPFACNFCSKRFAHRGNLHQHEQLHKNIKPHVCEYCDKRFSQRSSLTTHLRLHTGEKPFSCTICSKDFARKSYLKRHMMLHNSDNRFLCQKCDKTFSQRRNYEAHMARHKKNQIYQCEICRKTFKKAISLMAHKHIHVM